jgi:hypothetical protein
VSATVAPFTSAAVWAAFGAPVVPEGSDAEVGELDPETEDDEPVLHALKSTASNTTKRADRAQEEPPRCRIEQRSGSELIRPP